MASEWSQREGGGALITPVASQPMGTDVGGLQKSRSPASPHRPERRGRNFAGIIVAVLEVADFPSRKKTWSPRHGNAGLWSRSLDR